MSAKLLKGRYTATDRQYTHLVGAVRYLDPLNGALYEDPPAKSTPIAWLPNRT